MSKPIWFSLVKVIRLNPIVHRGPIKLGTSYVLCPKCLILEGGVLKRAIFWVFEPHKRSFLLGGMYGTFAHVSPIISWFWSGSFWVVLTIYEVLREVFKNNNFRPKFSNILIKRAVSTEKDPQKAHLVVSIWNHVYYFVEN